MVTKSSIVRNIKELDRLYNSEGSTKKKMFYSKLALLELCGWIEETMDDIVLKCAKRKLKETKNLNHIKKIIENNYGFSYKYHFKKMMINVIGITSLEKVEKRLDTRQFTLLTSALGYLKQKRDSEAHTYLGAVRNIDAPSYTLAKFYDVYEGLKNFDSVLRRLRL